MIGNENPPRRSSAPLGPPKTREIDDWRGWGRATVRTREPDPMTPWEHGYKYVVEFDPPCHHALVDALLSTYKPSGRIDVVSIEADERTSADLVAELGRMLNL